MLAKMRRHIADDDIVQFQRQIELVKDDALRKALETLLAAEEEKLKAMRERGLHT
jgi:hypothetical protein